MILYYQHSVCTTEHHTSRDRLGIRDAPRNVDVMMHQRTTIHVMIGTVRGITLYILLLLLPNVSHFVQ